MTTAPKSRFSRSGPPLEPSRARILFFESPPEPPKAHLGAPGAARNPPKRAQEPPRARSNSQSQHAQNLGNMCIWPSGISKKRSRAIFRRSEHPPGTLQSGDPNSQGPPRGPKSDPGSVQGIPGRPPGPPEDPPDNHLTYFRISTLPKTPPQTPLDPLRTPPGPLQDPQRTPSREFDVAFDLFSDFNSREDT